MVTLEEIKESISNLSGVSEAVKNSLLNSLPSINQYAESWGAVTSKVTAFSNSVFSASDSLTAFNNLFTGENIQRYFSVANDSLQEYIDKLKQSSGEMGNFALKAGLMAEPLANVLPKASEVFGKISSEGTRAGNDLTDSFGKLAPALSKVLPKGVGDVLNDIFKSADKAKNLELALLRVSAASGSLNDMLAESGPKLSDIGDQTSSFAKVTYDVAQATGQSVDAVANYALELATIPGALKELVEVQGAAVSSMNLMEASLKVGAAYGLDNKTTADLLTNAYRELGTTGTGAVEIIARIGSAAQDLKIPLDILQNYTKGVSNQFKLMGDNSQAAINIMDRMTNALKDSGLGPQAIADITKGMVDGVKGMDEATKAFISGSTGGPGGLAGAFQIDFMIQQGQLDKVSEMITDSMQKQFGKVVTLADVNRNPGQAGELQKQVEYLKQVAGIAKSNEEAYRILEAMQKGEQVPLAQTTKTPEEALKTSIDLGSDIQKSQLTVLQTLSNKMEQLVQIQALQNRDILRTYTGATGETPLASILQSLTAEKTKVASSEGAIGVSGGQKTTHEDLLSSSASGLADTYKLAKSGLNSFVDYLGEISKKPEEAKVGIGSPGRGVSGISSEELARQASVLKDVRPTQAPIKFDQVLQPVRPEKPSREAADGRDVNRKDLIDGTLHIVVDVKDGVTSIARNVFDQEWHKVINSAYTSLVKRG